MKVGLVRSWLAASATLLSLAGCGSVNPEAPSRPVQAEPEPVQAELNLLPAGVNPVHSEQPSYDGPIGAEMVAYAIQLAWTKGDYAELDESIERFATTAERASDGSWLLSGVPEGIATHHESDTQWEELLRKIGEWRAQRPQSTVVDIAEAIILKEWAWSARGHGFANTVTPEGWKLFRERLQLAEAVLRRSREQSSGNPLWHEQYLEVALGLSWSEDKFRALYETAVARFPEYYPLYFERVRYLSPRWGGSVEAFDSYVTDVVRQTQAKHGKMMYARLYWAFANAQGQDFALFEESEANWRDMKTGFEQLLKDYPDSSWNLNNFAVFACRAGDSGTYRSLREKVGAKLYAMAWPENFTMEACDRKFSESG